MGHHGTLTKATFLFLKSKTILIKTLIRTESDNSGQRSQRARDLGKTGEDIRLMREKLDKTDTVRNMRETFDKWMDLVDGKLMFLNQQVKEGEIFRFQKILRFKTFQFWIFSRTPAGEGGSGEHEQP